MPEHVRPADDAARAPIAFTVVCLVATVVLAAAVTTVLVPRDPEPRISLDRARGHVEAIATRPHPMGTVENAAVRDYLVAELGDMGLEPVVQPATAPDYYGSPDGTVAIANVMARIEGSGGGDAIVFIAHYDTYLTTPGANDDAAGVAALLEMARILDDDPPLRNDVIVLFTDGEEPTPRYGASAFAEHPWFDDVALAVNVEGIGDGGPSMLVEMNGPAGWLIDQFSAAVADPVAFSFLTATADLIGGAATDFDVFRDAGVAGYNLAYIRGSSIYHTDRDTPARLHDEGMAHHGAIALGIARHFGAIGLAGTPADESRVFFTIPPRTIVHHAAVWLWIVFALGIGCLGWASGLRRSRTLATGRSVRGVGIVVAGSLVAAVAVTIAWIVLVAVRPSMSTGESYGYAVALVVLVLAAWERSVVVGRRWDGDLLIGTFVVWAALAAASAAWAPELGYVFVWGFLAGSVALLLRTVMGDGLSARIPALVVAATPVLIMAVPIADTFFLLAGPRPGNPDSELPSAIAVAAFVVFAVVALLASVAQRSISAEASATPRTVPSRDVVREPA